MKYDKEDVEALLDKVNGADDAPTADSENMIKSGAVAAALAGYHTKEEMTEVLGGYPTKEEMNAALEDVHVDVSLANEEAVRGIVSNYNPDATVNS